MYASTTDPTEDVKKCGTRQGFLGILFNLWPFLVLVSPIGNRSHLYSSVTFPASPHSKHISIIGVLGFPSLSSSSSLHSLHGFAYFAKTLIRCCHRCVHVYDFTQSAGYNIIPEFYSWAQTASSWTHQISTRASWKREFKEQAIISLGFSGRRYHWSTGEKKKCYSRICILKLSISIL